MRFAAQRLPAPGVVLLLAVMIVGLGACSGGDGARGADGTSMLLRSASVAPGADCASGGLRVESGADDDRDGLLDDAEVDATVFVCDGADGARVQATLEAPGVNCPHGGVMLTQGPGSPTFVCNGAPGAPGANGEDGLDGQRVTATPEPAGAHCAFGGESLQVGTGAPTYVCNGAPGTNGQDGQGVTMTPEPPGASCPSGGQRLQVGAGTPTYVCNGAPGTNGQDGQSVTMTPEPPGSNCEFGGVKLQVGSGAASYLCSGAPAGTARPIVETVDVTEVRYTDAMVNATVIDDGNELVLLRGVALATHAGPSLRDTVWFSGTGSSFATHCLDLLPGTTYHVRAFATNALGTGYGAELSFTTLALTVPAVATQVISNVTNTTALSGGDITDDGGTPVLARGVCWALAAEPTLADGCAAEGAGAGSFLALLTGLTPGTTYHVRAYATNAQGTSYGDDRTLTTVVLQLATVTTTAASAVSYTTASAGGNVVSGNGAPVTNRGICWATTPAPTTSGSHSTEAGGQGTFAATMSGLAAGTTYHVRAYAVNGGGTSYGNEVTFTTLTPSVPSLTTRAIAGISSNLAGSGGVIATDGGSPITAKGVCWSLNPDPIVANGKTTDGTGPASFNSTMTGLNPLTAYHVRAYATNALGTSYGNDLGFTTTDLATPGPSVPVVGTSPTVISGSSTAASGGYVSSDGGSAVSARGACWSASPNPTLANACSTDGGTGVGFFSTTVTGLSGCGVVYYVRAYATNATGTGYGGQNTVSTGLLPALTTAPVTGIGFYGATSGGTIADDGGCAITQKGVVWSFSPGPTTNATSAGAGSTPFVSSFTGLLGNRTYYVRSYATNSVGTAYGQQEVFTTLEPPTPYVGQSYAGGIVFYVDGTGQHGMVTAPANQGSYTWGCVNTNIATSAAFGAGATNTATLVASCGEANTAAKVADGLVLNGYDDWFLPSVGELNLMRANLYMQGLGGLGTILSSTPQDIRYALALDFAGNYWNWWAKDYPAPVRAIRAF